MVSNTKCRLELDLNRRCAPGQACSHTAEISALEDEIAKLEAQCKAKRADDLEQAYWHNATHDPLNRVPPEVASSILRYANPLPKEYYYDDDDPVFYLYSDVKVPARPLELASVCRRWRALAFSEPRLWTTIVMQRNSSHWNLSHDLVNQWIGRSGHLPLIIVLAWDPTEDALDSDIVALVKHICALSHRWRSITVRVPSAILPFFRCDTSILLDLQNFTFISTDDDGVSTLVLGQTTIRPGTLTLAGVWTPPENISWTNITRLDMYRVIPAAFLGVLPECTRLDEMRLAFIPDITGNVYPEPIAIANLPSVTRLTIEGIQEEHVAKFFMHIRAPSLRVICLLRYKDDIEASAFSLASFQHLLMQSEVTLERLVLTGFSFFNEDLTALLETLTNLSSLTLSFKQSGGYALSDQLLTLLSTSVVRTNGANFLPKLTEITYEGPRTFSWSSIAQFAEAHNGCDPYFVTQLPANKRPFSNLSVTIQPQTLPDDYIDEDVLLHFMKLPATWVKTDIEGGLMEASFEHHGLYRPKFVFRHPLLA